METVVYDESPLAEYLKGAVVFLACSISTWELFWLTRM